MPHAGRSSTCAAGSARGAFRRDFVSSARRSRTRSDPQPTGSRYPPRRPPPPLARPAGRISSPSRLSATFSLGETHVHNGFLRT